MKSQTAIPKVKQARPPSLRRRVLDKVKHLSALTAVFLSAVAVQAQSTSNQFYWTGATNNQWNTISNWNFGPGNNVATTTPQGALDAERRVIFDALGNPLPQAQSIVLNSNVALTTASNMPVAFLVKGGAFSLDLNNFQLNARRLSTWDGVGESGSITFTNSSATPRTFTASLLDLASSNPAGATLNWGTLFGANVNSSINTLGLSTPTGSTYVVDFAGKSQSVQTLLLGAAARLGNVSFVNSDVTQSTFTYSNLNLASTENKGATPKISDLVNFGSNITVVKNPGTLTIGENGGINQFLDLDGQSYVFTNGIILGNPGANIGKVTFSNSGAPADLTFGTLTFGSTSAYGSTLNLGELFGPNITATQEVGNFRLTIQTTGGVDQNVDLNGKSFSFSESVGGITIGGGNQTTGKVFFTNSGAPATLSYSGLNFSDMSAYGNSLKYSELFGSGILAIQISAGGRFEVNKTAAGGITFDLEGNTMQFSNVTVGDWGENGAELRFGNSSASPATLNISQDFGIGLNGSHNNVVQLSEFFGENVQGEFNPNQANNASRMTVGSANGGRNNMVIVDNTNENRFRFLDVRVAGIDAPSNNKITIENDALLNIKSVGNAEVEINVFGDYYIDEANKTGNLLHVRNGGQLIFSPITGSRFTKIGTGSEFRVDNGGYFESSVSGIVEIAQNGRLLVDGPETFFILKGQYTVLGQAIFSNGAQLSGGAGFDIRSTGSVLVDGTEITVQGSTSGSSDSTIVAANGPITVEGGGSLVINTTSVSGAGRGIFSIGSASSLQIKDNSSVRTLHLGVVNGPIVVEEGSSFTFSGFAGNIPGGAPILGTARLALQNIIGAVTWGTGNGSVAHPDVNSGVYPVGGNARLILSGGNFNVRGTTGYLNLLPGSRLEGNGVFVSNNPVYSDGGAVIDPGNNDGANGTAGTIQFDSATQGINIPATATSGIRVVFDIFAADSYDRLLAPVFISNQTITYQLNLWSSDVQAGDEFPITSSVSNNANLLFDFSQSAPILAAEGLEWDTNQFAATGTLKVRTLGGNNNIANWRQTWFGSTANIGNGANSAIPANDGVENLLKFATNASTVNPTMPGVQPGNVMLSGQTITFTYTRNKEAIGLVNYQVKWSDTLTEDSWSTANVALAGVVDQGSTQLVTVTLPRGSSIHRYVRLEVEEIE